jgi:hypothetical protein
MGKEVAVQPHTRTVHVLCHAYGRKLIVIDLALARNTGLSSVGGRGASFCGVAKSDGCWNRGDPLCVSWDMESFVSLHSGNNRIRTVYCCGLCALLRLMVFFGCQLEISEIAPCS